MKSVESFFCATMVMIGLSAFAETETVDGIEWTFTTSEYGAEVGGYGKRAISMLTTGDIAIPDKLGGYLVTSIGDAAFYGCSDVTGVKIPSSVTSIGRSAFTGSGLKAITIPRNVQGIGGSAFRLCHSLTNVQIQARNFWTETYVFEHCDALKSIIIPPGLDTIAGRMFSSCTALETVVISNGVSAISSEAFWGCSAIQTIKLPQSVNSIGSGAFSGCTALSTIEVDTNNSTYKSIDGVVYDTKATKIIAFPAGKSGMYEIPATVLSIQDSAFESCAQLTTVVIPASVTSIGNWAFFGCSSLQSVNIPESVTSIGNNAFMRCKSLRTLNIPDSVINIGYGTFSGCGSLETIMIPDTITSIANATFNLCTSLVSITLPSKLTSIGEDAFSGCAITNITLPVTVTELGSHAFYECKSLVSVDIPNGIDTISQAAFCGCSSIKNVTLPQNVTTIESYAFRGCKAIESILLPENVKELGNGAFENCSSLKEITINGVLDQFAFSGCTSLVSVVLLKGCGNYIPPEAFSDCTSLTTVSIPSSVTMIASSAFDNCPAIRTVLVDKNKADVVKALFMSCGIDVSNINFVVNVCDIVFNANGGDGGCSTSLTYGVSIEFPSVSRNGYSLEGWFTEITGGEEIKTGAAATSNRTFYAHWMANSYSVRYNANGGDFEEMENSDCSYGSAFDAPASAYSRTGYDFVGWALTADGKVAYRPGDQILNLTEENGKTVDLYAVWKIAILSAPQITPADNTIFGGSCRVVISSPKDDARVYYRVGANPKIADKFLYKDAFAVTATSTIYAFAKWGDATSTTNRVTLSVGNASNLLEAVVSNGVTSLTFGGDGGWQIDSDNKIDGKSSVKIGSLNNNQSEWIETEVTGPGTISFCWRTSCEEDELQEFDHLEFKNGDEVLAKIDGISEWKNIEQHFGEGVHVLRWTYMKDDSDAAGDDCGWIDGVAWTPDQTDPIPDIGENPTPHQIIDALDGSTDTKLAENITDGATYGQYRDWASKVKAKGGSSAVGADVVKNAPNAWLSFALGSETLIETAPSDGDLKVDNFEPATESGKFDFTVSVTDIEVGSEATAENLKKVFGLEGGTTLAPGGLSSDNVNITFGTPENGKVKFTAGPKNANERTFFMKVKMTP